MTNDEMNNSFDNDDTGHQEEISDDDRRDNHEKKNILKVLIKIIVIIAIFSTAFYFIYFKTGKGKAKFVLSNQEIHSIAGSTSVNRFSVGEKVYFFIKGKGASINANTVTIKMDIFKDKVYSRYKQITYEIERDFAKLSTIIPAEYFRNPGKYKIEVFLDGNSISSQEIDIVK